MTILRTIDGTAKGFLKGTQGLAWTVGGLDSSAAADLTERKVFPMTSSRSLNFDTKNNAYSMTWKIAFRCMYVRYDMLFIKKSFTTHLLIEIEDGKKWLTLFYRCSLLERLNGFRLYLLHDLDLFSGKGDRTAALQRRERGERQRSPASNFCPVLKINKMLEQSKF